MNYRENTLLNAFTEVKTIDLSEDTYDSLLFDVEENYNISIQVLKERGIQPNIDNLPSPYLRLYGNTMSISPGIISQIMLQLNLLDDGYSSSSSVDVGDGYVAFVQNIIPTSSTNGDDVQLLSLCAATDSGDGLLMYYILTVTVQSIRDSISVFNTFTIIIGFIFMIISGIFTYLISYRFTNPILEINQVARQISNLDFGSKVEVSSNDEIGDLGNSINLMSTQLENAISKLKAANEKLENDIQLKEKIDSMRKEFIASASHELKTPISLILGYAEALKLPGIDKDTSDDYLNIIMDESNKMNKLVMEMLKISQLESGFSEFTVSDFSVKDMTDETARLFSIIFEESKINVTIDVLDREVSSDYDQLQTVLSNFISNAIHHVDKNKKIRIYSEETNEGNLRLVVFNTGLAIAESDQDRVWESFYKVDKARTRSYGGQGLGLSIVRNTLDNIGYGYGVKNVEGGVEFYLEIPAKDIKSNNQ